MWIHLTLTVGEEGQPILESYQLDGEETVPMAREANSMELISFIAGKAKLSPKELLLKRTVKLNIRVQEFQEWFQKPTATSGQVISAGGDMASVVAQLLQMQVSQMEQQRQFMSTMLETMRVQERRREETVKPDMFDGESSAASTWLDFYEYACEKNRWTENSERIKNLRLFLAGNAKKWYELRVAVHSNDSWDMWKESFTTSFDKNAVERWDEAIFYKHRGGSLLDYFYEKRRLLQLADSNLPETSIVPLVIHGMSRDAQRQVQAHSPKTIEDLLYSLKDVFVDHSIPYGQQRPLTNPKNAIVDTHSGQKPPVNQASNKPWMNARPNSASHETRANARACHHIVEGPQCACYDTCHCIVNSGANDQPKN